MSAAASWLARALDFAGAHGAKVALEAGFNFVLPFAIFSLAAPGLGPAPALMLASGPPVLWSLGAFIVERRIDAISVVVRGGIVLSLLAFAGGGGVRALQLRENLVAGLVGLVFLGSAAIRRPLIYQLARAGVRRRAADRLEVFEALRYDWRFRAATVVATLAWGAGLSAACALNCVLVFAVSIRAYLLISGPVSYGAMGALSAWTFWYVPREMRRAEARAAGSDVPPPRTV